MKEYLISTVSIILFISILELFVPNNKISGFVKMIIGIIVIFIMLSPILNFFSDDYNFSLDSDNEYSNYLAEYEKKVMKEEISLLLLTENIVVKSVEIEGEVVSGEFIINLIFIKIEKEVINSDIEHINKLEKVKELITERLYLEDAEVKIEYENAEDG